ncbi:MAG: FxsA family protein [Alphaproteobacteria bacterium]
MVLLIFLALLGVPLIEIAVFIEVGGRIGLWSTLALIVLTAIVGTALLRQQGLATLSSARATVERGGVPVQEVLDGVCLLVAGALLLTPGFVTDAAGALLLVPAVRRVLQRWALDRLMASGRVMMTMGGGDRSSQDGDVIDGEYTVERDDDSIPPPRPGCGDKP